MKYKMTINVELDSNQDSLTYKTKISPGDELININNLTKEQKQLFLASEACKAVVTGKIPVDLLKEVLKYSNSVRIKKRSEQDGSFFNKFFA